MNAKEQILLSKLEVAKDLIISSVENIYEQRDSDLEKLGYLSHDTQTELEALDESMEQVMYLFKDLGFEDEGVRKILDHIAKKRNYQ